MPNSVMNRSGVPGYGGPAGHRRNPMPTPGAPGMHGNPGGPVSEPGGGFMTRPGVRPNNRAQLSPAHGAQGMKAPRMAGPDPKGSKKPFGGIKRAPTAPGMPQRPVLMQ